MKLAEALILRSDLQSRINNLRSRIEMNVKIQEGDKPSEDPQILMKEANIAIENFTDLVKKINNTNNTVIIEGQKTISDVLVEREGLQQKITMLKGISHSASIRNDRYTKSEVKFISMVDVSEIQKQIEENEKEYQALDTKIQQFNWLTDIIE